MHKALCSALVGVSFLLAACSDSAAPNVSRPSPRSDPAAQQLAGLLITNDQLPSGLSIAPDQVGDTGPSNLAKAVHDDVGPNARAVLTQDQFVAGYQRMWRDSPSNQATQVVDFLYQFSGSGGALSYQQRIVTLLSLGSPSPQLFPVSDIANAIGLTGTLSSSRGARPYFDVLFAAGPYEVQVHMEGPAASQGVTVALAKDQFAKLGQPV